jgi:hypothetical protein
MAKTHTMVKAHKRKLPKLGSGKRFAAIEAKAKASGAKDPAAVAAAAGIAAHGQHAMTHYAEMGRARHHAPTLREIQVRRGGGK